MLRRACKMQGDPFRVAWRGRKPRPTRVSTARTVSTCPRVERHRPNAELRREIGSAALQGCAGEIGSAALHGCAEEIGSAALQGCPAAVSRPEGLRYSMWIRIAAAA